ncbi:MAG: class I SAM-dependent methyltransferase [Alphaproteobacteria bacterium]
MGWADARKHRAEAAPSERFGKAFYQRFYLDPGRAVTSRREMELRGRFIGAFIRYSDMPVRRILDAGCGLGLMRPSLRRALPTAEYVGLEASPYLCRKHGWHEGSVVDWRSRHSYELVICYDVFQYLGDRDAARGLANLGRLASGILYFSALTLEDWRFIADRGRTDRDVARRPAAWYRRRLARNFIEAGAGFWIRRGANVTLWSLETTARASHRV